MSAMGDGGGVGHYTMSDGSRLHRAGQSMHDAGPIFSEAGGLSSSRHSITTSATRVLVFDKLSEFAVADRKLWDA